MVIVFLLSSVALAWSFVYLLLLKCALAAALRRLRRLATGGTILRFVFIRVRQGRTGSRAAASNALKPSGATGYGVSKMSVQLAETFGDESADFDVAPVLDRDGYAVLRGVASRAEVAQIRAAVEPLLARVDINKRELGERGGAPQIIEVQRILELSPGLSANGFIQRAQAISARYLGGPVERNFDHVIFKPARNMKETAWHQDAAYSRRLTFTAKRLHWWLPLHDVTDDQSCMRYVPGSHKTKVAPHVPVAPTSDALRTNLPPGAHVVSCPLNEGDACIHLPNTLHATGPNLTDRSRTAFIVQFSARTVIPRLSR